MGRLVLFILCGLVASSFGAPATNDPMNAVAEKYAHLVLALGQHDPDYVDAFYGPPEWRTQAEREKQSLDAIAAESKELSAKLEQPSAKRKEVSGKLAEQAAEGKGVSGKVAETADTGTSDDDMVKLRREYLQKQIS